MKDWRATGRASDGCFPHGQYAIPPIQGGRWMVSLQTADFSPAITNPHVFRPVSQLQGFGFSPVTGFLRTFFNCGRQSLHPSKCGIRNAETSASSVEPCGVRNTGGCPGLSRLVPPSIFFGTRRDGGFRLFEGRIGIMISFKSKSKIGNDICRTLCLPR